MTQTDFAKLAGVSRAAVSLAVKNGKLDRDPEGQIDERSPSSLDYLQNANRQRRQAKRKKNGSEQQPEVASKPRAKTAASPGLREHSVAASAATDESRAEAEIRKIKAQADRAELEIKIKRRELIETAAVKIVFAQLISIHQSQLQTFASKLGPDLTAMLGLKDVDTMKVQEAVSLEMGRTISHIKHTLMDFLEAIGDGSDDED